MFYSWTIATINAEDQHKLRILPPPSYCFGTITKRLGIKWSSILIHFLINYVQLELHKGVCKNNGIIKGKTDRSFNSCAYTQVLTSYLSVLEWT
jgi:hypothetical protein